MAQRFVQGCIGPLIATTRSGHGLVRTADVFLSSPTARGSAAGQCTPRQHALSAVGEDRGELGRVTGTVPEIQWHCACTAWSPGMSDT